MNDIDFLDAPKLGTILPRQDFRSSYDHAFDYPGQPLEFSYTTDGHNVLSTTASSARETADGNIMVQFEVTDPKTGELVDLNSYLKNIGVPVMEDRTPIIAYGANSNPASLFRKFNFGKTGDPSLLVVPVIKATREGSEIAWTKNIGARGRQFADMITNKDVAGTTIDIAVNFLTHDQLAIMHSTERAYDIVEQGVVTLEGDTEIPGFYYSSTNANAYGIKGKPVAVSSIQAEARIGDSHSAESSLQSVLDQIYGREETRLLASDFLSYFESLDLDTREQLKTEIAERMDTSNLVYNHERPVETQVHTWAYNFLPSFGQLLNGYEYTGVQGRMFTNDEISGLGKRALVEEVLYR